MEPNNETVRLQCVKEGNKLRIKIISPGYAQAANCQFPRDIRIAGREYTVPKCNVIMADTKGKFFYRIKKNNIKVVEPTNEKFDVKVYGDENLQECSICFDNINEHPNIVFVIIIPCGHHVCCDKCAYECKERAGTCPMCRAKITAIITKDQLQ
jgi:hypothetical protein